METIEIYVRGNAHTPARFWDYAIITDNKQNSGGKFYIDNGFAFSKKDTDLYKSLTDEERKKVKFLYINGVKQF